MLPGWRNLQCPGPPQKPPPEIENSTIRRQQGLRGGGGIDTRRSSNDLAFSNLLPTNVRLILGAPQVKIRIWTTVFGGGYAEIRHVRYGRDESSRTP
jgi:hypothetical protein